MSKRRRKIALSLLGAALAGLLGIWLLLPQIGAHLILVPLRKDAPAPPPAGIEDCTFSGEGVELAGWRGEAEGAFRGTLIYLHGVSDHRGSGGGVLDRFRQRGFDVLAYDSRAHGESGGDFCTYGFHEKRDLSQVLDTLRPGPVVLLGSSLGAAVALQTAAENDRVSLVVAAESFSSLRAVVTERAPGFFSENAIRKAIALAEKKAGFTLDEVSPAQAAASIGIPVLVIHGAEDHATQPHHARRIADALAGPHELILVEGADHNQCLRGEMWERIESWIDRHLPSAGGLSADP